MSYGVKEIFYTLQGEGAQVGRPSVFCRFAGCNLWSGHEKDRSSAICQFCDTDFVGTDGTGGGSFATAEDLADAIERAWPAGEVQGARRYVVCTGGEPLLQLDSPLVKALHDLHFEIAIETNGTKIPPEGVDWICVSPKANADLILRRGSELKIVFPQDGLDPESLQDLDFDHFFVQPMDGPERERNTQLALDFCLHHPRWRLSLQTHKLLGIP